MVAHQAGRSRTAKATQRNPILKNQKHPPKIPKNKTNKQTNPKTKQKKPEKQKTLQFRNYAEAEWTVDRRTRMGLHFSYFGFSVSASTDLCFLGTLFGNIDYIKPSLSMTPKQATASEAVN